MRRALCCLILFMLLHPVRAEETSGIPQSSLFLTPQESDQAEILAQKAAPPGQGDIRLDAIMFDKPDDWIVWLQGQKWTPQTSRDDLRILQVSASEVRLSWRSDDDMPAREITLSPHQSFQIATGKIISAP